MGGLLMPSQKIEVFNEQEIIKVSPDLEKLVIRAALQTLAFEKIEFPLSVEVLFVDNMEIRRINFDKRNIDSETDVLSFPMLEYDENKEPILEYNDGDFDLDLQQIILGDIVISLERAMQQAEDFAHPFEREVAYLTVHSMLHLLGYDHEEENDKEEMRQKEESVLKEMDLTR